MLNFDLKLHFCVKASFSLLLILLGGHEQLARDSLLQSMTITNLAPVSHKDMIIFRL